MHLCRSFTVVDGAIGPVVYRFYAATLNDLIQQLLGLGLTAECAFEAAAHAWSGALVAFDGVPVVVVPGDLPVQFGEFAEHVRSSSMPEAA